MIIGFLRYSWQHIQIKWLTERETSRNYLSISPQSIKHYVSGSLTAIKSNNFVGSVEFSTLKVFRLTRGLRTIVLVLVSCHVSTCDHLTVNTRLSACPTYTERGWFKQGREISSHSTYFQHFSLRLFLTFLGRSYTILMLALVFLVILALRFISVTAAGLELQKDPIYLRLV